MQYGVRKICPGVTKLNFGSIQKIHFMFYIWQLHLLTFININPSYFVLSFRFDLLDFFKTNIEER